MIEAFEFKDDLQGFAGKIDAVRQLRGIIARGGWNSIKQDCLSTFDRLGPESDNSPDPIAPGGPVDMMLGWSLVMIAPRLLRAAGVPKEEVLGYLDEIDSRDPEWKKFTDVTRAKIAPELGIIIDPEIAKGLEEWSA